MTVKSKFPTIKLSGSAFQIGLEHGKQLKSRIPPTIEFYRKVFAKSDEEILVKAKHFKNVINKKITTHGLRATCQNYWGWNLNLSPRFIQTCLGHADFNTTMKHYNTMNKDSTNEYLINYQRDKTK